MIDFVEECRREWRRLGVPDPVANEMAADLTADLQEAEAEGGTPEDVLGNSAFDPRRFAAAWAAARGVTSPAPIDRPSSWRPPLAIAVAVLLAVVILGAGLALVTGRSSASIAYATHRVVAGGPVQIFPPGSSRFVIPHPLGLPVVGTRIVGVDVHPLALMLFVLAVLGLGLLAMWYWSPWPGLGRYRRRRGARTASWN